MTRTSRRCHPVAELPEPTDWETMFNGSIYQCEQGRDFDCSPEVFALIVKDKARRAGIELRVKVDGKCVVAQAVK